MLTTFAERLKDVMMGPPKITNRALAAACGVSQPSVSEWRTGETKSIEGRNLLAAAEFLGVRPKWLAEGVGPKYPDPMPHQPRFEERRANYEAQSWPFKTVTHQQYSLLDDELRQDVEKYVLLLVNSKVGTEKHNAPGFNAKANRAA